MRDLLKRANALNAQLKTAGSKNLRERMNEVYASYIKELAAVLPKALDDKVGRYMRFAHGRTRITEEQFSLDSDGYLLVGGRGEKMPDLMLRVHVMKRSNANFMEWSAQVSGVGRGRGEQRLTNTLDDLLNPEGAAFSLSMDISRALDKIFP